MGTFPLLLYPPNYISSMDDKHLHHPLLSPSAYDSPLTDPAATEYDKNSLSSNFRIGLRFLLVILVGLISTWANHEASKGFVITVSNGMEKTPAGEKFSLFYVSNDEAIRLVQTAADFATVVLYPNTNGPGKKLIDQVDIHLASQNVTHDHIVITKPFGEENKYVLSISPRIMEFNDFRYRIRKEIQRSMAEILLRKEQINAPKTMLDGIVVYISNLAGFEGPKPESKLRDFRGKCWEDRDPQFVAQFLGYCEGKSEGFIGRLNEGVRENWDEKIVDTALGMPANDVCESFHYSVMKIEHIITSNSISTFR